MAKEPAIVLSSGSLQSAVTVALAAQRHRVVMIYIDDGTRGVESPAQHMFVEQSAHYKATNEQVLPLPFLGTLDILKGIGEPAIGISRKLVELLPIVAIGARFAAHHQAKAIYLGLRAADDELAQVTEFGQIWAELLQLTCGMGELTIEMPLLELEEWQIVDLGAQLSAPMDKSWSCHGPGPKPCVICPGCKARHAAFVRAAKPDTASPAVPPALKRLA